MKLNQTLIALGIAALTATGCGGDTYVQGTTTVSKGQELTDLQRALNEGAISQSDYEQLRKKVLARPN